MYEMMGWILNWETGAGGRCKGERLSCKGFELQNV